MLSDKIITWIEKITDKVETLEKELEEQKKMNVYLQEQIDSLDSMARANCSHARTNGDSCEDCGVFV